MRGASRVLVATDDVRIAAVVRGFGGEVVMTHGSHQTGTDRVAEVAKSLRADVVVNLQGDEPIFDPAMVEEMVAVPGVELIGSVEHGIGSFFVRLRRGRHISGR